LPHHSEDCNEANEVDNGSEPLANPTVESVATSHDAPVTMPADEGDNGVGEGPILKPITEAEFEAEAYRLKFEAEAYRLRLNQLKNFKARENDNDVRWPSGIEQIARKQEIEAILAEQMAPAESLVYFKQFKPGYVRKQLAKQEKGNTPAFHGFQAH